MAKEEILKPNPQLLIKLGSIIIHYEEWTSGDGHELDKAAIDSLRNSEDVKAWIEGMNKLALLPLKRKK